MSTEKEPFICKRCRAIPFRDLTKPVSGSPYSTSSRYFYNKSLCDLQYTQGCAVCELLLHPVSVEERSCMDGLRTYPFGYANMPGGVGDSFSLEVWSLRLGRRLSFLTVGCVPRSIAVDHSSQDVWDCNKARSWVQDCNESHKHRHDDDETLMRYKNISLIDCHQRIIVDAEPSHRWVALSYVWGDQPHTSSNTCSAFQSAHRKLPQCLPRTVEDAITVTQQLGFQYLWVDEYCIDQHHARRQVQIAEMDKVHRGAELTIVAAAGEDKQHGLPGIGKTPHSRRIKVLELDDVTLYANLEDPKYKLWNAKWFTRGWTLQEGVLSPRVLIFTEYQTLFYCPKGYCTEGLGEFLTTVHAEGNDIVRSSLPAPLVHLESSAAADHFHDIVELYTARNLSYDSDALRALSGIFENIRRLQPGAYNLIGLRFFDFGKGSAEDVAIPHLVCGALAWKPARRDTTLERRPSFPSWTWAGWKGRGAFGSSVFPWWSSDQPMISNVQLSSHIGEQLSTSIFSPGSEGTDVVQSALDDITTITFDAPTLSAQQYLDLVAIARDFTPPKEPAQQVLVDNLQSGAWACVFVSVVYHKYDQSHFKNLLIVEWKEDRTTAERVELIPLGSRCGLEDGLAGSVQDLKRAEREARLAPFPQDIPMRFLSSSVRRVKLV